MILMFDLEQSIADWRQKMRAGGIASQPILDELESHLRREVEERAKTGSDGRESFDLAVRQIGEARALKLEFIKAGAGNWNRRLVYAAWAVYAVSFFLPSYGNYVGWKCAVMQGIVWDNALRGNWACINYELLTLANLFMLASPFLLFRVGSNTRRLKWLPGLTISSLILIWSFIGLLLTSDDDRRNLRFGCFVWAGSFVLLFLATFRWPNRREQHV